MKPKTIKTDERVFARVCSITGEGMNEGYCILDGDMYIKDHEVMVQHITDDTDYADIDEAYEDDYYYYTEWDVETEIETIIIK